MMYSGTDQFFGGRALNELISDLTKARPAATALSQNAATYERLSETLNQVQAQLSAAMNQAQSAHRGAAGDASQEHTVRQAAYATDATADASSARGAVATQSQHHADTLARMPQPAEKPNVWEGATIPLDPSFSYIARVRDYAGRQQQAVDAMNSYQGLTNNTVREFALFASPTTSPVGLSGASGVGSPRFPGGGATAGVQPPGAGAGSHSGAGGQASSTPGAGGAALLPQGVQPPAGTAAPARGSTPGGASAGSASREARSSTGEASPALTPLRPRPGVPGAWDGGGSGAGAPRGPGATGIAAEGSAGKGSAGAARSGTGNGFVPMGAERGRGDQEHRRPPWLLEDDPEAAFGPMPPHAPPVIEASDPWEQR